MPLAIETTVRQVLHAELHDAEERFADARMQRREACMLNDSNAFYIACELCQDIQQDIDRLKRAIDATPPGIPA